MNTAIVGELFEIFNSEYGVSVADGQSLFDGQRDLLEFVMGLGRRLEQQYFQALGSGYVGTRVMVDGVECCFKGNREKTIHGLFGKVKVTRAYYVGPGSKTYYPLDEELSLHGHSPGLQYFLALFTGQNVYQKSLGYFEQIFRPEGRETISMRKALDMDYELGRGLEGLRQEEIEAVGRDEPVEKQRPIAGLMAVSIDATKVREKLGEQVKKGGKKSYEIGWRDAKVASVSAVQWDSKRTEAKCVDTSYVSAVEHADLFFKRIWVEMHRRSSDPEAKSIVFLADGANWIWDRIGDLANANSIQILDFYHAAEHLSQLCKELYGEQTPQYWKHYKRWKKMFLQGKAKKVIRVLKTMAKETGSNKAVKALLSQIGYFQDNLSRMDYRRYRRMRVPIGSGTIESACKNVIGGRMKQGGMTWSTRGADGMLQIRSSQESDRFQADFQRLLAA